MKHAIILAAIILLCVVHFAAAADTTITRDGKIVTPPPTSNQKASHTQITKTGAILHFTRADAAPDTTICYDDACQWSVEAIGTPGSHFDYNPFISQIAATDQGAAIILTSPGPDSAPIKNPLGIIRGGIIISLNQYNGGQSFDVALWPAAPNQPTTLSQDGFELTVMQPMYLFPHHKYSDELRIQTVTTGETTQDILLITTSNKATATIGVQPDASLATAINTPNGTKTVSSIIVKPVTDATTITIRDKRGLGTLTEAGHNVMEDTGAATNCLAQDIYFLGATAKNAYVYRCDDTLATHLNTAAQTTTNPTSIGEKGILPTLQAALASGRQSDVYQQLLATPPLIDLLLTTPSTTTLLHDALTQSLTKEPAEATAALHVLNLLAQNPANLQLIMDDPLREKIITSLARTDVSEDAWTLAGTMIRHDPDAIRRDAFAQQLTTMLTQQRTPVYQAQISLCSDFGTPTISADAKKAYFDALKTKISGARMEALVSCLSLLNPWDTLHTYDASLDDQLLSFIVKANDTSCPSCADARLQILQHGDATLQQRLLTQFPDNALEQMLVNSERMGVEMSVLILTSNLPTNSQQRLFTDKTVDLLVTYIANPNQHAATFLLLSQTLSALLASDLQPAKTRALHDLSQVNIKQLPSDSQLMIDEALAVARYKQKISADDYAPYAANINAFVQQKLLYVVKHEHDLPGVSVPLYKAFFTILTLFPDFYKTTSLPRTATTAFGYDLQALNQILNDPSFATAAQNLPIGNRLMVGIATTRNPAFATNPQLALTEVKKGYDQFQATTIIDTTTNDFIFVRHADEQFDDTPLQLAQTIMGRSDVANPAQSHGPTQTNNDWAPGIPNKDRKAQIAYAVQNSKGKTVFWFEGHGSKNALWLSNGAANELQDGTLIPKDPATAITTDNLAQWLIARGNLSDMVLVLDACYSYDFAQQVLKNLSDNHIAPPLIITATNRNAYSIIGKFNTALLHARTNANAQPDSPLTGAQILASEEYLYQFQDLAVLLPTPIMIGSPYTQGASVPAISVVEVASTDTLPSDIRDALATG